MRNLIFVLLVMISATLVITPSVAQASLQSEIENGILCTCGCANMVLDSCECGTAGEMKATIKKMIENGMNKDMILQDYVEKHGQKILSAPSKDGFNLVAWITPILGMVIVGGLLIVFLRKWTNRNPDDDEYVYYDEIEDEQDDDQSNTDDIDYKQRLEDDLKDISE